MGEGPNTTQESVSSQVKIALLTGVLAFVGASLGTFLTSHLEDRRADHQFRQQLREHMLDKRLAVIEKCTRARAMQGRLRDLNSTMAVEEDRLKAWLAANKRGMDYVPQVFTTDLQRERATIQVEQLGCMQGAAFMFGPKTAKAAAQMDMSDETWWVEPKNTKLANLFLAMGEEGAYLPKTENFTAE
jgi:hypothetical protein